MRTSRSTLVSLPVAMLLLAAPAWASFHTWDTNEVFSNADGTIQFVEMVEAAGFGGQHLFLNRHLTTNAVDFTFPNSLGSSATANRFMLLGTAGFAALPGAPTPDYIIPDNYFAIGGDTISLRSTSTGTPFDSFTFGAVLPLDGVSSLNRNLTTGVNSPTNFAGVSGSVDLRAGTPPGVPDGVTGSPMIADKLDTTGSQLRIAFDDATCSDAQDHQIVFGGLSQLPAAFAGTYSLDGSRCNIGSTSPFDWTTVPDPATDPTGGIWWLLLANDSSTTEGSWGRNSGAVERSGPATGGASGECGITVKDVTNTCGF